MKGYYKGLLAVEGELKEKTEIVLTMKCGYRKPKASQPFSSEKSKEQIEKACRLL